ncbi:cytochrome-c peroxidase [Pontibacter akesuensis]|uniref:Cytochrome c peroxidase n=1 Tax=Pontibacter akesuensis TaxID=388950 RepID=A0A1I7KUN8_9BACT|nr:cytochrome c peroxidase [Pontibacter akesuensis]GHA78431.1 cytochrome-c peroxidase [Pontibacter akesuensis]SFV01117.1 cytochrome c peroxidase [Pontibacter akesuensis]
MKKIMCVLMGLMSVLLYFCSPEPPQTPSQKAKAYLLANLDTLEQTVEHRLQRLATSGSEDSIRFAFLETRRRYKKVELFTEYYAPTASKALNGAPLPEYEVLESKAFEPSGLQVIEEHLYPEFDTENREELVREVKKLKSVLGRARVILEAVDLEDANLLNACKQEVYRIMVLGISGFDTPLTNAGVQEATVALQSVQEVLGFFGEHKQLQQLLQEAVAYTSEDNTFNGFDRMAFIMRFANPITVTITDWQQELGIMPLPDQLVLNTQAATLFSPDILNNDAFAGSANAAATPDKIALGKVLFFSPVVSGGTRTCGSCHKPELAFTDGLPKSAALQEGKFVQRNAPTLYYAGLQHAQFYDMRATTLESQAVDVIRNKDEMHASVEEATQRLNQQPHFVQAFQKAYPGMEAEVQPRHVMLALATYVRSLTPFSSRFDKHMRDEQSQLTEQEIKGFNLFMGKAKCGTCHFMPVFNGTAAPAFTNTEAEVLGVLQDPDAAHPTLDPDEGRFTHSGMGELRFAFKTPTLRNISKTAPYMHNGAYETLEEVMDFYNKGGAQGMGLQLDNQTLPPDPLNLSEEETEAIIAFLQALTDEEQEEE